MDDNIPHPLHFAPRHITIAFLDFDGDIARGFTDNRKIPDNGIQRFGIGGEFFKRHSDDIGDRNDAKPMREQFELLCQLRNGLPQFC